MQTFYLVIEESIYDDGKEVIACCSDLKYAAKLKRKLNKEKGSNLIYSVKKIEVDLDNAIRTKD